LCGAVNQWTVGGVYSEHVVRNISAQPWLIAAALLLASAAAAEPDAHRGDGPDPGPGDPEPPSPEPEPLPVTPLSLDAPAESAKPPPLHVDYFTYGVGVTADFLTAAGRTCADDATPCILGSGGGLVLRGGYRSPGPWYIGGAYQFSTTDSSNLYRLGTLQQARAEMRYIIDLGYRTSPYAMWGLGGVWYGNEFGVETGGGTALVGLGFEMQLSRLAAVGGAASYQPMVFAGFVDTADFDRETGVAHYVMIEFQVELRSELSRD
jgi:hypothetical protein